MANSTGNGFVLGSVYQNIEVNLHCYRIEKNKTKQKQSLFVFFFSVAIDLHGYSNMAAFMKLQVSARREDIFLFVHCYIYSM